MHHPLVLTTAGRRWGSDRRGRGARV